MVDDSLTNHPAIKRANSVPSSRIQSHVSFKQTVKNNAYCFYVRKASELSDPIKERIWTIFESNMKIIYESGSVFPWDPPEKREQMFHDLSRFLLIAPDSGKGGTELPDERDIIAYSIFRFERDEGRNVLYVYELQTSDVARRSGLGRALIHNLNSIGRALKMSLIMLTHLKGNDDARAFYDTLGFEIDETSPDYDDAGTADVGEEDCEEDEGYSILSRRISL